MNKTNWLAVAGIVIAALVILVIGAGMVLGMLRGGYGYGGYGYGGWGMMGPWMMGGMMVMWIFPLGFLVLVGLGIAWLVRSAGGGSPAAARRACPSCGREVQADWNNCPFCGTALAK